MRLMLGDADGKPSLLVEVAQQKEINMFDFWVVNGAWGGSYNDGHVTINDCPSGDFTSLDKLTIICDNQDRLRGFYMDVFDNFHDVNYNAPKANPVPASWDDDIPF